MAKRSDGGGLVFNALNIAFTVFMFALPTVALAYWYFYIRVPQMAEQANQQVERIIVQTPDPVMTSREDRSPTTSKNSGGGLFAGPGQGVFSESPNTKVIPSPPADANPPATQRMREERELRTWRDTTGAFSIEARFYSASGKAIKLQKSDDSKIEVPIEKLSAADKQYLRDLFKTKGVEASF